MKILVADDSKIARKMIIKSLEDSLNGAYEIIEAQDGNEACEKYKEVKPNLVFLDLTMPVMDGFEALKKIKSFDNDAKMIVISADIQKQAIDKAIEFGANKFIKKPIDSEKMKVLFKELAI